MDHNMMMQGNLSPAHKTNRVTDFSNRVTENSREDVKFYLSRNNHASNSSLSSAITNRLYVPSEKNL